MAGGILQNTHGIVEYSCYYCEGKPLQHGYVRMYAGEYRDTTKGAYYG